MKVRMGRDELLTGLQRVQGVVEKRNTMPVLANILFEAKSDGVEIVATDLEIGMRGLYKAAVLDAGEHRVLGLGELVEDMGWDDCAEDGLVAPVGGHVSHDCTPLGDCHWGQP